MHNPKSIRDLYNISVQPPNPKNLQAVVSFLGQFYSPDDLAQFQTQFSLPTLPIEKTLGDNDPSNPGTEASLDVQYLTGIAGMTHLDHIWTSPDTLTENIRTWVYYTPGERTGGNEPFLTWLSHLSDSSECPPLIPFFEELSQISRKTQFHFTSAHLN